MQSHVLKLNDKQTKLPYLASCKVNKRTCFCCCFFSDVQTQLKYGLKLAPTYKKYQKILHAPRQ